MSSTDPKQIIAERALNQLINDVRRHERVRGRILAVEKKYGLRVSDDWRDRVIAKQKKKILDLVGGISGTGGVAA